MAPSFRNAANLEDIGNIRNGVESGYYQSPAQAREIIYRKAGGDRRLQSKTVEDSD